MPKSEPTWMKDEVLSILVKNSPIYLNFKAWTSDSPGDTPTLGIKNNQTKIWLTGVSYSLMIPKHTHLGILPK